MGFVCYVYTNCCNMFLFGGLHVDCGVQMELLKNLFGSAVLEGTLTVSAYD